MSWICPECGNDNKDELIRCVCGYETGIDEQISIQNNIQIAPESSSPEKEYEGKEARMIKAKLIVRFKKNFLQLAQWGPAIGLLDGKRRFTIPWWTDKVIDIDPGEHNIRIAVNAFLIMRGICEAELYFEITSGETLHLEYRMPLVVTQPGRIDIYRERLLVFSS